MEVKKSLLMPKTNFEMRGNLAQKEPLLVKRWQDIKLYDQLLNLRKHAEEYQLHDGPPYANGNIHCGHMLNRILKDFTVRYQSMKGYKTPFVFGWDTHGLPIENQITKSGVNRKTTPIDVFREKCDAYARGQVEVQKEQIRRLGMVGDYDHPYMTLTPEYEAEQIGVFAKMALKGLIFKGLKPVHWSPSSESALAEAEIEYANHTSHAIYVRFMVNDGKNVLDQDVGLVIWTTTPWTLPANLAISVHPDFTYGIYQTNRGKLVFLTALAETIAKDIGLTECILLKTVKGSDLEFVTTHHPFYDRDSVVICGEHVTADAGTGLVHTAPGHGEEDYIVGQKYHLDVLCPVDSRGYLTEEAGEALVGQFYEDANKTVLSLLEQKDALLKHSVFTHSYPHDWRTGKPLIFRATPQWFCSIEPIRQQLLDEVKKVKWTPSWGELRISNMIKDRGDWCISRQRAWGVPIPIFYAEDGTPIIDEVVFTHIEKLFREHGSNIWFKLKAKELLPEGYTHPGSPNGLFTKENDIMDVWFDSGSSSTGVLKARNLAFPADLYLEGSDQYRGWFNSSLIISVAAYGVAPYKAVVTHGFVVDENWDKMSKSKGNGIDPIKIANTFGADILRLWAATIDYQSDVRISEDIVKQVAEGYRKIRNTFKFALGNLQDGEQVLDVSTLKDVALTEFVDRAMVARLDQVYKTAIDAFDRFDFANGMAAVNNFISGDLSSFYLDITKDVLYCDRFDSPRRKAVQAVIYRILDTLMRLLTPILPFTMEEVYGHIPGEHLDSVQLLDMPKTVTSIDEVILKSFDAFNRIRNEVLKGLEVARTGGLIGSAQEARITISLEDESIYHIFAKMDKAELARLFVVSEVTLAKGELDVRVTHHDGIKCERCWNYGHEGKVIDEVHLCPRCQKAMGLTE